MKGGAQPYEENISSGAGCLQPSWGSKFLSKLIETLIDMGRKMATFITVTTLWVSVGLVTIMLMPRQVGFAMLFVASLCLCDEDMHGGLQVWYHVQCFWCSFLPSYRRSKKLVDVKHLFPWLLFVTCNKLYIVGPITITLQYLCIYDAVSQLWGQQFCLTI